MPLTKLDTTVALVAGQRPTGWFNFTLAIDALTDREPAAHSKSITGKFPCPGETGTTCEIVAVLNHTRISGSA